MATASQLIADFVCGTDYKQLPRDAVSKAKTSILDCIGVALAGHEEESSAIVRGYVEEMGGTPEATIFGSSTMVPAANAALANGVASHVLDYDDTSFEMLGHPSAVTLPAAIAAGEVAKATGREVIAAYVLGTEVGCRLGAALTEATYSAGWHNTGIIGTFAAAAAAGKLLGLNENQMAHAIGAAASMAAGIKKNFGTSLKPYQAGQASSNGVRSAMLAKKGFTSSLDVLEGKGGFSQLFSKSFLFDRLKQGLGRSFSIDRPGFALKPYPSCAYTHGAIDAALELHRDLGSVDKIDSVECKVGQGAVDAAPYGIPSTVLEAKFSFPYCIAVSLCEGNALLSQFTERMLHDARVKAIMKRVTLRKDDSVAKAYGDRTVELRIGLSDGQGFEKRVERPRGDPSNPLSESEIREKYRSCASRLLVGQELATSEELVLSLDETGDVSMMLRALTHRR